MAKGRQSRRKRSGGNRARRGSEREPTTCGAPIDDGHPLEHLDLEEVLGLASVLRVDTKGSSKSAAAKAVESALASPERWESWLLERSGAALVVLEILAEAGGPIYDDELIMLCLERGFDDSSSAESAVAEVVDTGLAAGLGVSESVDRIEVLVPWQGSCAPLLALLQGVTLPATPPDPSALPENPLRDILAVVGLAAHRRVRFTQQEEPDRTTLRSFSKGLGPKPARIRELLITGMEHELLRARGDRLVPSLSNMKRSARATPHAEWIRAMPDTGWVLLEAFARADARSMADTHRPEGPNRHQRDKALMVQNRPGILRQRRRLFADHPGLERVTHQGDVWIRRVPRSGSRSGDGHVTPSFEVLLGPDADLDIVWRITAGCELVQLDRVLRFRITPESVAAGLRCGLDRSGFLDALDRVGSHPVPDSVKLLVGEWADAKPVARVESGWFLFCPVLADEPDKLRALEDGPLGVHLLSAPVSGALAVEAGTPRDLLESELAAHGIALGIDYPMLDAHAQRDARTVDPEEDFNDDELIADFATRWTRDDGSRDDRMAPPWPLDGRGLPALRAVVDAARASGFASEASSEWRHDMPGPLDPDGEFAAEFIGRVQEVMPAAGSILAKFGRKVAPAERERLAELQKDLIAILPFIVLAPKWQRRCVRDAVDIDDLLAIAREHCGKNRFSRTGAQLVSRLEAITANLPERMAEVVVGISADTHRHPGGSPSTQNARAIAMVPEAPDSAAFSCGGRHPAPGDFPEMGSGQRMLELSRLVDRHDPLFVLTREGPRTMIRHLWPHRVRIEGQQQMLLGTDIDTGEDRAITVRTIESVIPA